MSVGGGAAEASVRPRYVVDVGSIRVAVDNEKDAIVARRVAHELAALKSRASG